MREKSIYNLLVFVLVVAAVGLALSLCSGDRYANQWSGSRAFICGSSRSYAVNSSLYNYEKASYSKAATAYDILTSSNQHLRIVFDYAWNSSKHEAYNYKMVISSPEGKSLKITKVRATLSFSSTDVYLSGQSDDLNIGNSSMGLLSVSDGAVMPAGSDWTLDLSSDNDCVFRMSGKAIEAGERLESDITDNTESKTISVPSGFGSIGFSDWRSMKPFFDAGIKVFSYNRGKQGIWQSVEAGQDSLFEPGVGYYLDNLSGKTIDVDPGTPFEVPVNVSTHTMRRGWNLLYNDYGENIQAADYEVSVASSNFSKKNIQIQKRKLSQLVDEGLVHPGSYMLALYHDSDTYGSYEKISEAKVEAGSAFWVYLYDETDTDKINMLDLDLSAKTDKDSYKAGDLIRISSKVTNNSSQNYSVDINSQEDPCEYGFIVFSGEQVIYSSVPSSVDGCPSWPRQTDLLPGSVIEYNQTWEIPEDISGELRIVTYFDQSRVFSEDRKTKQVLVSVGQ